MTRLRSTATLLSLLSWVACSDTTGQDPGAHPDGAAGDGSAARDGGAAEDGGALDLGPPEGDGGALDLASADLANVPSLTLLAGALGGYGTGDGTGPTARFLYPADLVADGAGSVFIVDSARAIIRRLNLATGAVTTFAGTAGLGGHADGVGPAARFNFPDHITTDGAGNLYVSDFGNRVIRRIVIATAAVTTIAGTVGMEGSTDGVGGTARFSQPAGLAYDPAGELYIADRGNQTIRRLTLSTGQVATVAGATGIAGGVDAVGPSALFNFPDALALVGGDLYVSDSLGHTIRKVTLASATVTTVAGTNGMAGSADGTGSAARFSYPGGLVSDGAGSLYVCDGDTMRRIVLSTRAVTTMAGAVGSTSVADGAGAQARFGGVSGATRVGTDLYLADQGGHVIRKMAIVTAAVTTVAGAPPRTGSTDGTGGAARFLFPSGLSSPDGVTLFAADTENHTVRQISASSGAVTTLAGQPAASGAADGTGTAARFYFPFDVHAAGDGNLYVSDSANNTIRKVIIATGAVTTLAGSSGTPGDVDGVGAAAQLRNPAGLAGDGAGNLYVSTASCTIRKVVVATGAVTTLAGSPGMCGETDGTGAAARFDEPIGLVHVAGALYVADRNGKTVRRVALPSGQVTTLAGAGGMGGHLDATGAAARFVSPYFLASDGAGALLVSDSGSTLRKIALATGAVTTLLGQPTASGVILGPLPARLNAPRGVATLSGRRVALLDENSVLIAPLP